MLGNPHREPEFQTGFSILQDQPIVRSAANGGENAQQGKITGSNRKV